MCGGSEFQEFIEHRSKDIKGVKLSSSRKVESTATDNGKNMVICIAYIVE
jgi:hypothetical protein